MKLCTSKETPVNRLHKAIEQANGKPLLGVALYSNDPLFLDIAMHMGYKVVWIEMEHIGISFAEAMDLCRMAAGTGMLTMIRIPDTHRENVLKACECGPDIIDVPMVNTPEQIEELLRYARFAPGGERGYFSVSRALKYGLVDNVPEEQQRLNEELSIVIQIETVEALERIDELAAVPGVDIFIGPADLAASLGYPGQTNHPKLLEAAARIVKVARLHGKKVMTACGPADFIHWTRLGIDLLFCTNNMVALKVGAQLAMQAALDASAQAAEEAELLITKAGDQIA